MKNSPIQARMYRAMGMREESLRLIRVIYPIPPKTNAGPLPKPCDDNISTHKRYYLFPRHIKYFRIDILINGYRFYRVA